MTEADELIRHPSIQRELTRFRSLGGSVKVSGNKISLFPKIIPVEVAQAFAQRIRKLDIEKKLDVVVA